MVFWVFALVDGFIYLFKMVFRRNIFEKILNEWKIDVNFPIYISDSV